MAFLLNAGPDSATLQGLILSAAEAACQQSRIERRPPPRLIDFSRKAAK